MAKRATSAKRRTSTTSKRTSGASASGSSTRSRSSSVKAVLSGWYESPAFKYVAGGVGLAVLSRLAMSMSDRYPQISTFFRDNLDIIETKLSEFRGQSDASEVENARH